MKPLIRWAGSKRKLLNHLRVFWNDSFKRYVEPFAGSACLFFDIEPKKALIADQNWELIRVYRAIRDCPEGIYDALSQIPRDEISYYALRDNFPPVKDRFVSAVRFLYLNRFCFNGIYRTNINGKFNVPYSGEGTGSIPTLNHLLEASRLLKRSELKTCDFELVLNQARPGDFVYLDPPYSVENRRIFKQYGPSIFGLSDLDRLAAQLLKLNESGIKFVLSYAYCREALERFGRWTKYRRLTARNVAGFAKHRRKNLELMFTNINV